MENLFLGYWKIVKKIIQNKFFIMLFPILWAVITTIFINLFTSQEGLNQFPTLQLNPTAQLWFLASFGLIAFSYLLQSLLSIGIICIFFFIIGFPLYVLYIDYIKLIYFINFNSNIILLVIIMLLEFSVTILILYIKLFSRYVGVIIGFTFLFLGILTLKVIDKELKLKKRLRKK